MEQYQTGYALASEVSWQIHILGKDFVIRIGHWVPLYHVRNIYVTKFNVRYLEPVYCT